MAVALLLCVAIFITALYNLCKTYLGNSPILIEPSIFLPHITALVQSARLNQPKITPRDLLQE